MLFGVRSVSLLIIGGSTGGGNELKFTNTTGFPGLCVGALRSAGWQEVIKWGSLPQGISDMGDLDSVGHFLGPPETRCELKGRVYWDLLVIDRPDE